MVALLRNRVGIPGLISVIALVFAMLGGAYAANETGGKEASASAKAKRGPAGPRGPKGAKGAKGATGPIGLTGPVGPKGDPGPKGDTGSRGDAGADGKSVIVTSIPVEENECEERGGAMVQQQGAPAGVEVCNGEEGSPWTAGGTLPGGATQTGFFTGVAAPSVGNPVLASVSFALPLDADLAPTDIHMVSTTGQEFIPAPPFFQTPVNCTGNKDAPTAPSGKLCIYMGFAESIFVPPFPGFQPVPEVFKADNVTAGASNSGAVLKFVGEASSAKVAGSFAVTG